METEEEEVEGLTSINDAQDVIEMEEFFSRRMNMAARFTNDFEPEDTSDRDLIHTTNYDPRRDPAGINQVGC